MTDNYNGKRLEEIKKRHAAALGLSNIDGKNQIATDNADLIYLYTTIEGQKAEIENLRKQVIELGGMKND